VIYTLDTLEYLRRGGRIGRVQALAELLRQRLNLAQLEILRISPVLGVHTGPGIVGAAVTPMELMEF